MTAKVSCVEDQRQKLSIITENVNHRLNLVEPRPDLGGQEVRALDLHPTKPFQLYFSRMNDVMPTRLRLVAHC